MPIGASRTSGSVASGHRSAAGSGRGPGGRRRLARGGVPARARQLPQRGGGLAVDHHLNVVRGRVGVAGRVDARGFVRLVRGCVPAPDREIEASRERQRVVDDDDLLVVSPAERVGVVEPEGQARVGLPGEAVGGEGLAFQREQHREVPGEREHPQRGPAGEHVVQERQQRERRIRGPGVELDAAVDVPAEHEHALARAADGVAKRGEVGVGIDQERGALRLRDTPAVFPFAKHAREVNHALQIRGPNAASGCKLSVVESATEVRYGGVVVGRSPQVRDQSDDGAFVVFSEPLPVGTAIALKIDDKERHARVTEVVESADAAAAGMRVRFGAAAERSAPPRARTPGTRRPAGCRRAGPGACARRCRRRHRPRRRRTPVVAAPAPAAAAPPPEPASAPVPVPVPAGGEPGSEGVHPATDSHAHHHDGEGGRRRRRRK